MANKNANFLQVSTKYHRIPNNHTQCPRLEIAFSYVECSESVSVLFLMHVFIEY